MGNTLIKSPIEMSLCGNNTIRGNTFQLSNLHLINSTDNTFHRNNFILSAVQIEGVQNNTWDDRNSWPNPFDCPICGQKRPVGNYWGDYQGEDNGLHTQLHNCPGDGIGDTELPVHGVDYYPLMKPWVPIMGDLDYDGRVSIKDLYKVAKNFDKTSP
jgi:nitrous oxidase accessory protein NosD